MTTQTATRERPILFSGDMIRAILAGRKSQTRRVIFKDDSEHHMPWWVAGTHWQDGDDLLKCPYGQPGDLLWVKEVWAIEDESKLKLVDHEGGKNPDWIYYRDSVHENTGLRWRSPIFMPRWASRITLEITGVRVERLQEITGKDAITEGIESYARDKSLTGYWTTAFARLWDDINVKRAPWASNPWVWCISFRRIKP